MNKNRKAFIVRACEELRFGEAKLRVTDPSGQFPDLLNRVRSVFSHILSPDIQDPTDVCEIRLVERSEGPFEPRSGPVLFRTRLGNAYGLYFRTVVLRDKKGILFRRNRRLWEIRGQDLEPLWQALQSLILSLLGEQLENVGFLRLHAMAYSHAEQTVILSLPSGAGKSYLSLYLLENTAVQVLTDELIFYRQGQFLPLPMSLKHTSDGEGQPKISIPLPSDRIQTLSLNYTVLAGWEKTRALRGWWILRRMGLWRIEFSLILFLGLGVPQMREFFIRSDTVPRLPLYACKRLLAIFDLWRRTPVRMLGWQRFDLAQIDWTVFHTLKAKPPRP